MPQSSPKMKTMLGLSGAAACACWRKPAREIARRKARRNFVFMVSLRKNARECAVARGCMMRRRRRLLQCSGGNLTRRRGGAEAQRRQAKARSATLVCDSQLQALVGQGLTDLLS